MRVRGSIGRRASGRSTELAADVFLRVLFLRVSKDLGPIARFGQTAGPAALAAPDPPPAERNLASNAIAPDLYDERGKNTWYL